MEQDNDAYDLISREFDEDFYISQLQDQEVLPADLIQHYLDSGWSLGFDPNKRFSTNYYIKENSDVKAEEINPFYHYLKFGQNEGRLPGPSISNTSTIENSKENMINDGMTNEDYEIIKAEMSFEFYRKSYPDLLRAEQGGLDLAEHYLNTGWLENRDPHPEFSTEFYIKMHADVREAKINPLLHYIKYGRVEGRICFPETNIQRLDTDNRHDLEKQTWMGYHDVKSFAHREVPKKAADLQALDFVVTLHGMNIDDAVDSIALPHISDASSIDLSFVIPCYNQGMYTLECIKSITLSMSANISFEVIIVDNGSSENIYDLLETIDNIVIVKNKYNYGFGRACNQGVSKARGKYVMILNNDAQLAPGCAEHLLRAMDEHKSSIGIAVPKVISFNGLLQEAGCRITSTAAGCLVGLNDDHRLPRYNYERWVTYGSAVALVISKLDFEALGGFDDVYAPAYYEDVDLGMRLQKLGKRIRYIPTAMVAHHLSQSTSGAGPAGFEKKMSLVVKNQQTFRSKWQRELLQSKLRLIAFYLPQYHPIPENDRWWGAGFTEWTNVVKATANYVGHRQPRRPSELGYYDLRAVEVMEHQARLAKKYGINGFCYYYYWFSGKKLLELPLERMLATGRPDHPFCLCWANENWTRTWDGMSSNVLIAQDYTVENDILIIKDLANYFSLDNYIRVDGKPLFLVYRVKELPLFTRTAETWRNYCRSIGIGEIIIAAVESFELSATPEHPSNFGCDITVEFPPHGMVHDQRIHVDKINPEFTDNVYDYKMLAQRYMQRDEPGWTRVRSLLVGWDNTPRRQNESLILENSTPGAFQAWLEWTIERTLEMNYGDERLVFINAWNEWCEGSYLEPDAHFGHAYLQAVRNAIDSTN